MLVDSHCHLSNVENLSDIVKRANDANVRFMLNAGGKIDELETNLEICNKYEGVQAIAVAPKSTIIVVSFLELPVLIGTTVAPIFSAPLCAPRPPVNKP